MKKRVILTTMILAAAYFSLTFYALIQAPVEGSVAVSQINDGMASYAVMRSIVVNDGASKMIALVAIVLLASVWLPMLTKKGGKNV